MPEPDYFALQELRALPRMADANKYPDARCLAAAAYIVGIIERETGTSFVARPVTEVLSGGRERLILSHPLVLAVTAVKVDGVTVDHTKADVEHGLLSWWPTGSASLPWATGHRNVEVTYDAGYSTTPPPDLKEAALRGTRAHLLATNSDGGSQMSDRQTSITNDQGTVNFVVAGKDHPTGYPEVDATIVAWRERVNVFGFA